MSRALPPDLLRAARGVVDPDDNPFSLSSAMEQLLKDQGFAETHLHLGAALDFPLAWAALMRAMVRLEMKYSDFQSPGACFEDGRNLGTWLLHAGVVRLVLAEWLFSVRRGSDLQDLLKFVGALWGDTSNADHQDRTTTHGDRRPRVRTSSRLDAVQRRRLSLAFSELMDGRWRGVSQSSLAGDPHQQLRNRFAQLRSLYRSLIRVPRLVQTRPEKDQLRILYAPENRQEVFVNDPIARVVRWRPETSGSPETLFTTAALAYITHGNEQSDFARLFWQVTRVRCLFYRHLVQRPLTNARPAMVCPVFLQH